MKRVIAILLTSVTLAACAPGPVDGDGFYRELPEGLAAMAGPNQNLNRVTLLEEDNCFWYEHVGPVETTLLPLRSRRGRHLCRAPEAEAA